MKLSDIKNEQALDVVADIIVPVSEILGDKAIRESKNETKAALVSKVIKNHKRAVIEILARLDGQEPEEYEFSILDLPRKLLEIFNDPALAEVFTQGQTSNG